VTPLRRRLTEAIALTGMRPPLSVPPRTRIRLRGKRVLITGASSGIGEAGAEAFAAEGAEVIVVARRADLLEELSQRIADAGGTASAIPCDLADLDAVDALAETVETRFGGVDILVNNAGRSIRAIFQLKGDLIRICYGLDGTTPTAFHSPAGSAHYLATYRRKK
jgi:NAD(P)-dependent dehydrogenase (short-subunit alcohol dehydrogenase family)